MRCAEGIEGARNVHIKFAVRTAWSAATWSLLGVQMARAKQQSAQRLPAATLSHVTATLSHVTATLSHVTAALSHVTAALSYAMLSYATLSYATLSCECHITAFPNLCRASGWAGQNGHKGSSLS